VKESDIMHECQPYWVLRRLSKNASIAPLGSVYYQIFKTGATCSESTTFVTANLERAKTTCDNMARVTSPAYRRVERKVAKAERAVRKEVGK
jgi:hypothetical protein